MRQLSYTGKEQQVCFGFLLPNEIVFLIDAAQQRLNDRAYTYAQKSDDCDDNRVSHNGILSCFFHGFSSTFPRSLRNPSAILFRVECG